jgi:hypothetical protein
MHTNIPFTNSNSHVTHILFYIPFLFLFYTIVTSPSIEVHGVYMFHGPTTVKRQAYAQLGKNAIVTLEF